MDIGVMLDLLVDDYINNMILGYENNLKIILTDEGVSVSNEDNMDSLIAKVDEEFDRQNEELENNKGLDIISATELPATGKENQICVITDNPVNKFRISSIINDKINDGSEIFMLNKNELGSIMYESGINIINNYYIARFYQGYDIIPSYIYRNNTWNELTTSALVCLSGSFVNTDIFGTIKEVQYITHNSSGLTFLGSANIGYIAGFNKIINLSSFKKIRINCHTDITVPLTFNIVVGIHSTDYNSIVQSAPPHLPTTFTEYKTYGISIGGLSTDIKCIEIDISDLTGSGYFRIAYSSNDTVNTTCGNLYFTDIEFLY
jgi:hypothetical protein